MTRLAEFGALAIGALALTAVGAPELDCLFQDGFVFSAAHPTRIAGRAEPGVTVTVKAADREVRATAGADGRFVAELPALGVRKTPFSVEVRDRSGVTTIGDCLSGLVLLAGGQSNMEVLVKETLDPAAEIAAANFPQIREFRVVHDFDFVPRASCAGKWTPVTPKTAADIGAIGYYTARRLQRELDGIPVGIVNNSYGGSPIQAWMPLDLLREKYDNALRTYDRFAPLGHDGVVRRRNELGKTFLVQDDGNKGEEMGWHRGGWTDGQDVKMPCFLDYAVYGESSDGAFWIARTFVAPEDFLGKDVEFRATAIDDYDITYLNGVRIGATGEETPDSYDMPRAYRIPQGLLKKGENAIAIRIFDTAHAGGIPPGSKIVLACGAKEFSLCGTWRTKAEQIVKAKAWPPDYLPLVKIYHVGSALYNAMFVPVGSVPYDAILWYQGETNAGDPNYGAMFDDLITRWRADIGQPDVPFVFMQLAAFQARPKSADDVGSWPLTRRHQAEARKLANVRMVPTIDIGDANRIHPLNKQEIGRRTALVLLQDFWAKDRFAGSVAYPEAVRAERRGNELVIELKDAKGLRTTDGRAPQSFSVVGPTDRKTRKAPAAWAAARIEGEKIVVELPQELRDPVRVRYAWHMNPDVNTVNGLGFPLLPFDSEIEVPTTLIVNADNDHYFCQGGRGPDEMTVAAMRAYVDEIAAGGKVTHLFLCPQGQRASFDSKTWEPIWAGADGATMGEGTRDAWCANARLCRDRGIDPYAVWIERARERKISPWISMRMNDIHGVTTRNHFRVTGFWRDHPELRRSPDRDPYAAGGSWGPFAFDYAHQEVRDYHFAMVKELVDRYDADGLELDWMRFPFVLREGRERADAHVLTEFMRTVRAYANAAAARRGRAYRISVRMPPRFASARGFGFDVDVWAKEGLVDMVSPCNFIQSYDFRMDIGEWRRVLGAANPDVRVVPGGANMCGCNSWGGAVGLPFEVWKGWCDVAFSRGAEGIYLFNADYLAPEVKARVYREGIDALAATRGERRYLASFDDCAAGPDATMGLRCPFKAREAQTIEIPVGTVSPDDAVSVVVAYSDRTEPPQVTLNGVESAGAPERLANLRPYCAKYAKAAFRWRFPSAALKRGDNRVGVAALRDAPEGLEGVWCEIAADRP